MRIATKKYGVCFILQYCAIKVFDNNNSILTIQTGEDLNAPIQIELNQIINLDQSYAAQILKADELLPRSVESIYKVLLYDLYCPSVQSVFPTRVCKHCSLYFAPNVMLHKHIIGVHKITGKCQPEVGTVRPLWIAVRRPEIIAAIAFIENVEFADWVDDDGIDITGLSPRVRTMSKCPRWQFHK